MQTRGQVFLRTISVALVCGGVVLTHGFTRGPAGSFWELLGHRTASRADGRRVFDDVWQRVAQEYVDSMSAEQLYKKSLTGMLFELHDPPTVYLGPDRARHAADSAEAARGGDRERAHPRAVMLRGGVGYIRTGIADSTAAQVRRAVESLRAAGARAIILDLRHDARGSLDQGAALAELFLRLGDTVGALRGRDPTLTHAVVDQGAARWTNLGVLVLIDGGSVGASEVVAGALQDHDRALLVGLPSGGSAGVQTTIPVDGGGVLRLTVARWYTPAGQRLDGAELRADDDDDADGGDGADTSAADSASSRTYRTAGGRAVSGTGVIVPDVVVADSASIAADSGVRWTAAGPSDARQDPVVRVAGALAAQAKSPTDLVRHPARPPQADSTTGAQAGP